MSWLVTQSCLNLCNLIDWIPPSSSVHGDSPGKNTGVVAMHSCRGSSHPRDRTQVSYIAGRLFTNQGTSEVHKITYRYTLHILLFLTVDHQFSTVQFSSVAHSCLPLCHPMNRNTPGLPIHHQLPEFTQTHVHQVSHASQTSHPLSFPSPLVPNPSQHQSLFQWVNSSHEVAKVLEFQL